MRILKSSVIALMLSLGMGSIPVFAAVPTDESLKELMKITKVDEVARQMMSPEDIMSDEMIQDILATVPQQDMSDNQRQQIRDIVVKYNKKALSNDYIDSVMALSFQGYIKAAKKHFTQQEVNAQIEFYSSELGKRIIEKQPDMMQDYMSETMPVVMQSVMERMQAVLPEMEVEIDALQLGNK